MHFLHHDHIVECRFFLNSTKESFANIVIISLFMPFKSNKNKRIRQPGVVMGISHMNISFNSLMVQATLPILKLPTEHSGTCLKMQTNSSKTKTMPDSPMVPIYGPGLSSLCEKGIFL